MVIGIGMDIVQVRRFEQAVSRHGGRLLNRLFTAAEQEQFRQHAFPWRHLAARFAAKEAAFKAIRTGWGRGVAWQDVEIIGGGPTPPSLVFFGRARAVAVGLGITQTLVSLSHDGDYAMACVIATDGR